MTPTSTTSQLHAHPDPLEQTLLHYVEDITPGRLPGVDGMTLIDVLHDYSHMASEGLVPDPIQLTRRHPELASEVEAFFGCEHQTH